jgi:hypothetical protein
MPFLWSQGHVCLVQVYPHSPSEYLLNNIYRRVSFPIRKMCRLVGDSASRNIERLSYANRLQARKLINTVPTQSNPSGYIIASSDDLLKLFDADCGLLSIRDETKILGELEQTHEALAMLEYLRLRRITSVTTSIDIREDFLDLRYPPGFTVIAGLLLVPLSAGGQDFIVSDFIPKSSNFHLMDLRYFSERARYGKSNGLAILTRS